MKHNLILLFVYLVSVSCASESLTPISENIAFYLLGDGKGSGISLPFKGKQYHLESLIVGKEHIKSVSLITDSESNSLVSLRVKLTEEGKQKLNEKTSANPKNEFAVTKNGRIVLVSLIHGEIQTPELQIDCLSEDWNEPEG